VTAFVRKDGLRLVAFRPAHEQHDVACLLAGLDVTGRLNHLVERIGPIDYRPILARFDEFLDEKKVLAAIAADA
jgi:hypothetical protein